MTPLVQLNGLVLHAGKYYTIHTDHLGSPRLMTDEQNRSVWQWPYSAFGAVEPTGILKATPKRPMAGTAQRVMLKKTPPEQAQRRSTAIAFAGTTAAAQAWNALDQLTQLRDPKGVATQYTYNTSGEVMQETSPATPYPTAVCQTGLTHCWPAPAARPPPAARVPARACAPYPAGCGARRC